MAGLPGSLRRRLGDVALPKGINQVDLLRWWLVVSGDTAFDSGNYSRCEEFTDPRLLADAIRELDGQDVEVHVFYGQRARVTKGPLRNLVLADGRRVPLFVEPTDAEFEDDGFLGQQSLRLETPEEEESSDYDESAWADSEFDSSDPPEDS